MKFGPQYSPFVGGVGAAAFLADTTSEDFYFDQDEFTGGTNASGQIGSMGWRSVATSGIDGLNAGQLYVPGELQHPGIYELNTTAVANSSGGLTLAGSGVRAFPLVTGARYRCVFRPNNVAASAFFFGLANDFSLFSSGAIATRYYGISYDTGAADTQFQAIARDAGATTKTVIATNIAPSAWHNLVIDVTATGITMTVDGVSTTIALTNVPQFSMCFLLIEYTTRAVATVSADVDVIKLAMPLTR